MTIVYDTYAEVNGIIEKLREENRRRKGVNMMS